VTAGVNVTQITEYTEELSDSWTDFVQRMPQATIAHDIGWRGVIRDCLGHRPEYLVARTDSRITGVLPLFVVTTWWRARYVVSVPWIDYGGVLAENPESEQMLLNEARRITEKTGARLLELRSVHSAASEELQVSERKVTFLLKLNEDPDVIWRGFDAKLRNQIRKADKSGLTTEYAGVEGLDAFYKVFSFNMRDLGTPVWGIDLFREILTRLSGTAKLILVRMGDEVIAGGLVLSFKNRLYVPSASAYRSYLKYCPNHALYWRVIKDGCEEGKDLFDFGRSSWDSGTFRFKKQWVPDPSQLNWQYYLNKLDELPSINPDNPKYRLFIRMWQKLPLPVANAIGPKVIKNFP